MSQPESQPEPQAKRRRRTELENLVEAVNYDGVGRAAPPGYWGDPDFPTAKTAILELVEDCQSLYWRACDPLQARECLQGIALQYRMLHSLAPSHVFLLARCARTLAWHQEMHYTDPLAGALELIVKLRLQVYRFNQHPIQSGFNAGVTF